MTDADVPRLSVVCPHCGKAVFISLDWQMIRAGHRTVYHTCGNCGRQTKTKYELIAHSKGTEQEK